MARVGLVLSGGMAKGAYQIGVLKVFRQHFGASFFSCLSAASIGCLNGYAVATDQLDIAEDAWLNLSFSGLLGFVRNMLNSPYIYELISRIKITGAGLLSDLYITCLTMPKPCLCYVNLAKQEAKDIPHFLRASVAVPPFVKPVGVHGTHYLDGALIDNIPVHPLQQHGLDYILVVYFDQESYIFENQQLDDRIIRVNFLDNSVIHDSLSFDKRSLQMMIDEGEARGHKIMAEYFSNGPDDLAFIYEQIRRNNARKMGRVVRVTGDIIVNNINKVSKKLIGTTYQPHSNRYDGITQRKEDLDGQSL